MFDAQVLTDHRGIPATLRVTGARFSCDSETGAVSIYLDTEEGMDWVYLCRAVEAQQAWESGDHVTEYTKGAAA